jgi:hypothetical protein
MGVDETSLAAASQEIRIDEGKIRAQGPHFAIVATTLSNHNLTSILQGETYIVCSQA